MKYLKLTNDSRRVKIDNEDWDKVNEHRWYVHSAYVCTHFNKRTIAISKFVMDDFDGYYDYIDRDRFNAQKANLRKCTFQEAMFNKALYSHNSSGFRGVSWHKCKKKWVAQITINKRLHYIGAFASAEEAAIAYDNRAIELHGPTASLNFPSDKWVNGN
jgi:hypothetical protein